MTLKNYTKSSLSVFYKWNSKPVMTTYLFTTWFIEYFKPCCDLLLRKKKIPFKNLSDLTMHLVTEEL